MLIKELIAMLRSLPPDDTIVIMERSGYVADVAVDRLMIDVIVLKPRDPNSVQRLSDERVEEMRRQQRRLSDERVEEMRRQLSGEVS